MYAWKGKSHTVEKPWGEETCWNAPWGTKGKIISIKHGHRTSLKYYAHKNECMHCLRGSAKVYVKTDSDEFCDRREGEYGIFEISEGDVMLIMTGVPYRFVADQDDCILLEIVSGPNNAKGVMLEDDYGRV